MHFINLLWILVFCCATHSSGALLETKFPWFKRFHPYNQNDSSHRNLFRANATRASRLTGAPTPFQTNPVVTVQDGVIRGFTMTTVSGRPVSSYQSIPYADPPVGMLRFKAPRKNKPWSGTRDAIQQSPECVQMDLMQQMRIHGQEDCLYLNVYVPQSPYNTGRRLPVMIFIHGGLFFYGSGANYGPSYLLDQEDVILVTVNYRLGAFGFLSTGDHNAPGNAGLKDVVLALKWVKQNIHNFGGDTKSITVFGQSTGAGIVQLLMVSPLARGLFDRAISQSGSAMCSWSVMEGMQMKAKQLGKSLNCSTRPREMVECLKNVSAEVLASVDLNWNGFPMMTFGPTLEYPHSGAFLTQKPEDIYRKGRASKVPWITGFNKNELSWLTAAIIQDQGMVSKVNKQWGKMSQQLLALEETKTKKVWDFYMGVKQFGFETRHNFSNMIGDRYFLECGLEAMRYHSRFTGAPVYGYMLTYQGRYSSVELVDEKSDTWGVAHSDDLIYLLNNTIQYETLQQGDPELQMSRMMTNIWANFATYGKPFLLKSATASGFKSSIDDVVGRRILDVWKPIPSSTNRFSQIRLLDLDLNPKMIDDPFRTRYNFWRRINPSP